MLLPYWELETSKVTTASKPSFKDLMSQMKEEVSGAPTVTVESGKKKLNERYKLNQGWYDALLNTDMVLNTHDQAKSLKLAPEDKRQIV